MSELLEMGKFFSQRGIIEKTITVLGTDIEIEIKRFTNRESDELMAEFLDIVGDSAEIDSPGLIEERIIRGLININFDFGGKVWTDLNNEEKRNYITMMHPRLRERISLEISGENEISGDEKGFLLKLS